MILSVILLVLGYAVKSGVSSIIIEGTTVRPGFVPGKSHVPPVPGKEMMGGGSTIVLLGMFFNGVYCSSINPLNSDFNRNKRCCKPRNIDDEREIV